MRNGVSIHRFAIAALAWSVLACAMLAIRRPAEGATLASSDAAAIREGVLTWYTSTNTRDLQLTVAEFERTHPGIRVQTLRLGSAQLPARIITEQKAGAYNADVVTGDAFQFNQLVLAGALDRYRVAEPDRFLPGTIDPNGYWTNDHLNTIVVGWNPERIRADHLPQPRDTADLADPRWHGKIGIDAGGLNWFLGVEQIDPRGAEALLDALGRNEPRKVAGYTQALDAVETGEVDASPTIYGYLAYADRRAGKAIAYLVPSPVPCTLTPTGLAAHAPHAAAARVFLAWQLSRAGQQWLVDNGMISSRTDVRIARDLWDPRHAYRIVQAPDAAAYAEAERRFSRIFGIAR